MRRFRLLPSCLTTVFAQRGRSVLTAEGLPAAEGGQVSGCTSMRVIIKHD